MRRPSSVLIVDEMHGSILPLLRDAGFDPVYLPVIDRHGILEIIADFEGLIIRSKTDVDQELISRGENLKFVARAGAGIDKLDIDLLEKRRILVVNAPEGNKDALGEHALGMLLSLLHRIPYAHGQIAGGTWDREGNRGIELKNKTIGIYGMGYMGKSFGSKLKALGCEVIGYDIKEVEDAEDIKQVDLETFKERTEILSIHVPLKNDTKYLFNKGYLSAFKKLQVVLNTARGEVLRTKDLVELLEEGKLYGAALDVLENEKLATYTPKESDLLKRLTKHPNVILTPHVGGWTFESYARINEVLIEKLVAAFPA
ncbi:MAG: 2-hydroxyacid dehydrogenase [Ekhidna sp.]